MKPTASQQRTLSNMRVATRASRRECAVRMLHARRDERVAARMLKLLTKALYSWAHGLMGSLVHDMGSWIHGSWVHRLMGSWPHRSMGSWVFMGSWGGVYGTSILCHRTSSRGPQMLWSMIHNIILPQIGLAQDKNVQQKTPDRETTAFRKRHTGRPVFVWCNDAKYYNIWNSRCGWKPSRIGT